MKSTNMSNRKGKADDSQNIKAVSIGINKRSNLKKNQNLGEKE